MPWRLLFVSGSKAGVSRFTYGDFSDLTAFATQRSVRMAPENQCFRERHQRTNQHVAKNKSCRGEIPLYAAISFLLTAFGMGGMPPLGYTVRDRKLIIAENKADSVRPHFSPLKPRSASCG